MNAENDQQMVQLIVRVPRWLRDALNERAEAEDRTAASVVRRALRRELEAS